MKYTFAIILMTAMTSLAGAQTMRWIPMDAGMAKGPCLFNTNPKQNQLCYALEYIPAASGTLTSYTTGFLVSCTSMGSPVTINQSCLMAGQVHLLNGCSETAAVLMNSSGNSGSAINSKIEERVPIILHQVCFTVLDGESVTIREDPITDLSTSISLVGGDFKTEYPEFKDFTIRKNRPDVSRPTWLDFKGIPAGDLVSQLDWSTSDEIDKSHFIIERSLDGVQFIPIGRVESTERPGPVNSYQFFDKAAVLGHNYYRLQKVDQEEKIVYSPVRTVTFSENNLIVTVTPNPANEYIQVDIRSPVTASTITLIDATGRVVMNEKNENKLLKVRLDVKKLDPGLYTILVETDQDKFSDKVVIVH